MKKIGKLSEQQLYMIAIAKIKKSPFDRACKCACCSLWCQPEEIHHTCNGYIICDECFNKILLETIK